jgi:cardiolipin synthase
MRTSPSRIEKKQPFLPGLVALLLCSFFVACATGVGANDTLQIGGDTSEVQGPGVRGVQVFVEPDAGTKVITNAIDNAKKSVLLEVYLLTNKDVLQALEEAAHRSLDVRVMLEEHPFGGGNVSPQQTIDRLNAAGVQAKGANPEYSLSHIKTMLVDSQTAYVMTSNLTNTALGVSKSQKNREYGIISNNPKDVLDIKTILEADWNRTKPQYNNPNLVVSPDNSRSMLTGLIDGATKTLAIEAEIMHDVEIAQHLATAAKRGVAVQIILPKKADSSETGEQAQDAEELALLKEGGVPVHESTGLYMHAKIIIADGQKAYVGSINFSRSSMENNRELGMLVADTAVLNVLQQTFKEDWGRSQSI